MSTTPPIPEHLRPLAPGYTPRQVELDAEMVALGRPSMPMRVLLDPKALAAWRETVEQWEYANPDAAARWLELRSQAKAEEAKLYAERYGPEAFAREQMRVAGFEEALVARALRELRDSACFLATRDWVRDGTQWSLVLSGNPGCGKTQAATWAAWQLLTRNGFLPRCARCPKLSESSLYGMEAEEERWRCSTTGVLVLDDLGEGEQRHEKRSAWRAWVDDVLTHRHANRKKTIITTNRSVAKDPKTGAPSELSAWLGGRLADRLREGVVVSTAEQSMRGAEARRSAVQANGGNT
jgi:DNA replication protein DnaC